MVGGIEEDNAIQGMSLSIKFTITDFLFEMIHVLWRDVVSTPSSTFPGFLHPATMMSSLV